MARTARLSGEAVAPRQVDPQPRRARNIRALRIELLSASPACATADYDGAGGPFLCRGVGGIQNALAGGGTFLTLPALMFTGMTALSANITSTVACFPAR